MYILRSPNTHLLISCDLYNDVGSNVGTCWFKVRVSLLIFHTNTSGWPGPLASDSDVHIGTLGVQPASIIIQLVSITWRRAVRELGAFSS